MVAPYTSLMPTATEFGNLLSSKLRWRLRIFLAIAVVILGFIVLDVWHGDLSWYLALLALAIGVGVGIVLGRLLTVKWHETEERVVSEMDIAGGVAIALYIAFDLSRDWIFGHWLSGPALAAFTLAILSGALFGRFIGMLISAGRVIEARNS